MILRMTKAELQSAPAFDTDRDAATTGLTTGNSDHKAPSSRAPAAEAVIAIWRSNERRSHVPHALPRFAARERGTSGRCSKRTTVRPQEAQCDRHE